jgi:hypothetical protein
MQWELGTSRQAEGTARAPQGGGRPPPPARPWPPLSEQPWPPRARAAPRAAGASGGGSAPPAAVGGKGSCSFPQTALLDIIMRTFYITLIAMPLLYRMKRAAAGKCRLRRGPSLRATCASSMSPACSSVPRSSAAVSAGGRAASSTAPSGRTPARPEAERRSASACRGG